MKSFFAELKRRNVYKVAIAYAVAGWLVMQVCATIVPALHLPDGITTAVVVLVLLGFPIALVIAWAFEMTPDGMKRTANVPADLVNPHWSRRKFITLIAVLAMLAAGLLAWQILRPKPVAPIASAPALATSVIPEKSIAVLPFDNLSRDPDNAFFAEGVQDEILTRLAKVADLKVISRTSTQHFKSAPDNLPQIARQLGVAHILEGSVQKSNDQVRVNVQLINALTDAHLWAEIYDRKLTDIFAVESDIAKTIADTLQAKLSGNEKNALTHSTPEDPIAHELYIKGRHFWGLRRGDNLPRALEFYNQAIARDPNYALAYAGLGETYILLPYYTGADTRDSRAKARAATLKALEINPNLAEAHNALGKILFAEDIDLPRSLREHERAIELSPNFAGALHWMSNGVLVALGRFEEAIAAGKRATELDPLSAVNMVDQGSNYMYARRFQEAEATFKRGIELDPTFAYAHWCYGVMLQASGDLERAHTEYLTARGIESVSSQSLGMLGQLAAIMGRREEALQALKDLDELGKHRYVEAYYRGVIHLSLGQKSEALYALEQSYLEHDGDSMAYIRVDPLLYPLHGDPRFEALAQKVIASKSESSQ